MVRLLNACCKKHYSVIIHSVIIRFFLIEPEPCQFSPFVLENQIRPNILLKLFRKATGPHTPFSFQPIFVCLVSFPALFVPIYLPHPLFLVVSELNGQSVSNAAESSRLYLPVVNWVTIKTNAMVKASLYAKTSRTEVTDVHLANVV